MPKSAFVRLDNSKGLAIGEAAERGARGPRARTDHQGGKPLKPGYQVKPGDELEIHYATTFVTVRVREVPLRVTPGVKPADLYEILESRKDEAEWR